MYAHILFYLELKMIYEDDNGVFLIVIWGPWDFSFMNFSQLIAFWVSSVTIPDMLSSGLVHFIKKH